MLLFSLKLETRLRLGLSPFNLVFQESQYLVTSFTPPVRVSASCRTFSCQCLPWFPLTNGTQNLSLQHLLFECHSFVLCVLPILSIESWYNLQCLLNYRVSALCHLTWRVSHHLLWAKHFPQYSALKYLACLQSSMWASESWNHPYVTKRLTFIYLFILFHCLIYHEFRFCWANCTLYRIWMTYYLQNSICYLLGHCYRFLCFPGSQNLGKPRLLWSLIFRLCCNCKIYPVRDFCYGFIGASLFQGSVAIPKPNPQRRGLAKYT